MLSLTFKPDIDDFRGSPVLSIASTLRSDGYKVSVAEPNISFHEDFEIVIVKDGIERFDVIALVNIQFLDKNIETYYYVSLLWIFGVRSIISKSHLERT